MNNPKDFWLQGVNNLRIYGQAWLPDGQPKAALAVVYGVGEYTGRYAKFALDVASAGYAVYIPDLRGHGQTEGIRGHINHFDEYHGDLRALLDFIQAEQPLLPVFLFGHSLGALIATEFIERETGGLRGAMLMGPPYQPDQIANPVKIALAKIMSKIWPAFPVDLAVKPEQYTRDPEIIAFDRNDPKYRTLVTARWGTECMRTVDYVNAHPGDIRIPVLILHGEADCLNSVEGSKRFYAGVTVPDKTLKTYPGGYHELHCDLDRDTVIADMVAWMDQRLQA